VFFVRKILESCYALEKKNGMNTQRTEEALNELLLREGESTCKLCKNADGLMRSNVCLGCCNYFESKFVKKEK